MNIENIPTITHCPIQTTHNIFDGGEPFFMNGGDEGILLIHGFTGLPVELRLLGEFLNREGYSVLAPRLAGHGTNERDLMRTNWNDWLNSAIDGLSILRGACKKISVIGHSMGGLLALKVSTCCEVDKVITLAAPIFIDDGLGLKNLPPREFCSDACIVQPRRKLDNVPPAANNVYEKTPLVSVHELVDLINDVKKILPTVNAPILVVHGEEDHTAQPRSARFIMDNVGSTVKRFAAIPNCGHLLPLAEERDFVFDVLLDFLRQSYGK